MAPEAGGYRALRLHVRGRSFHSQLFARSHVSRADDLKLPAGRTLFALNMPRRASSEAVVSAFAVAGEVSAVHLGDADGDTRPAHVVFAAPAGLKKALAAKKTLKLQLDKPAAAASSSSELQAEPKSRAELQRDVDEYLQRFEKEEAERQAAEDAAHNRMDADGFVLVTRKRTGRSTSTEEATGATAKVASGGGDGPPAKKKKKKSEELQDFYHFQQHEKKRQKLLELRESFEADKARIAKMRGERKFKPQGYHVEL